MAYMVDRWSRRKALGLMGITWSVFTFITGTARSFAGVLLPRLAVGIGEAGFPAASTALLGSAYSEKNRARILGLFSASMPLGMALGMMLGGYLSETYDSWRVPFYVFAVPGIILGIMAFFLKDYKTVKPVDELGNHRGFFQEVLSVIRIPTLRWMYAGYAANLAMVMGFMVWISAFIMRTQELSVAEAGMIGGTIGLMGIIGGPMGGFLADFWQSKNIRGRAYTMAVMPSIASITLFIALHFDLVGIGYLMAILAGIFLVACTPAANSISQDVVAPSSKAISWALAAFFSILFGAAWAPPVVGAASDMLGGGAEGLKIALMMLTPMGLIASVCFYQSARHYPQDTDKVKGYSLEGE
ncbi:MFS transporter [Maricurvus nonylphenolicus]|uniref:MFS transporter n=1 Tax=Maricurvus nonylphenolicus TaxID=1008307 RepID=UPI0036F3ACA8